MAELYFNDHAPIGVIDSGIGGLTVANAIRDLLPNEAIYYFGDTAHLPYGDKSAASVRYYTARITDLLVKKGCKCVVIACNTASSFAAKTAEEIADGVKVIDVVTPVIEHIIQYLSNKKIGIIGTKGTIESRIYPRRLKLEGKNIDVKSMATPLLASMVEEGFFKNKISKAVINQYLSSHHLSGIEALVLACTHYPLIKPEISSYYNAQNIDVEVVDNASLTAKAVRNYLEISGLLNSGIQKPDHFMVSDYTKSFEVSTQIFFGEKVSLEEVRIWD
ncbi:glutamate racemase [Luteibaculum oceani]|uniref:Glutamate racemase n=1 Tax=Luteibaculum oceani TaxID=1294296 RepID=A0A5C6V260_9FLAO|nr:glutamate racemase [Luteibaculum oceani]TXC78900.1 glutamate racemase [Luteibaculum oceani]